MCMYKSFVDKTVFLIELGTSTDRKKEPEAQNPLGSPASELPNTLPLFSLSWTCGVLFVGPDSTY